MSDYALALSDVEVARYLRMAESAHRSEARQWAIMGIGDGTTVADVGCGPGALSTLLAGLVGPSGRVWAVDQNPQAVATAEQLAARLGLANVRCQVGQASATGLARGSVDVAVMRHVLAHNGGHEQAIVDHLATLVRPGGFVYLVDVEAWGVRMRPEVPDLIDLSDRYFAFQAARGNDVSVGLRLGDLITAAGLELVELAGHYDIIPFHPGSRPPSWAARQVLVDAGAATTDDVARWAAAFERIDAEGDGCVTTFVPLFSAIGRRA